MKNISIIVPCRNEYNNIYNLINSILLADYDLSLVEVLIIDGMSTDGTRDLVNKEYKDNSNIFLIDNPNKTAPFAFNIGIKAATSNIVIIAGARFVFSKNYFSEVVDSLKDEKIGCVGGRILNTYENETSKVITKAMASSFGIGFGNFRTINEDRFVDTVTPPAFRRDIFDELGYFDERLTRNQDDDFSFRLIKAGYKILLKSNIHIEYVVRGSLSKLYKQYKQYGYWKVFVSKKHKTITTLRQIFPSLFVISLIIGTILSLINNVFAYLFLTEISLYLVLNFWFSFKDNKFNISNLLKQMLVCFVLHISYGLGYLDGIFDFIICNKQPNSKNEELSR